MKVVLLAGGVGTRLREETEFRPKPMVEIGGHPILWHIMKIYSHYGFSDFVVCLGYKGDIIRDYFLNYQFRNSDFTVTLGRAEVEVHNRMSESGWRVTLAETGKNTLTGGRIQRARQYLDGETFMCTYGDGVADVDIPALLRCHHASGKQATVTAVRPSSRYGELSLVDGSLATFREKPQVESSWINGGFMVFERSVLNRVLGEKDSLEIGLLARLADEGQLNVYQHTGFWQCMDTYREAQLLNDLWGRDEAPWRIWDRRSAPATAVA
jgi:glucose-1-phosphate cytidylyltransferase